MTSSDQVPSSLDVSSLLEAILTSAEEPELAPAPVAAATSKQKPGTKANAAANKKIRGVTQHRRTHRYEAHIWDEARQVYLGAWNDPVAAAKVHDLMAMKCRGLTAQTNYVIATYASFLHLVRTLSKDTMLELIRRHAPTGAAPAVPVAIVLEGASGQQQAQGQDQHPVPAAEPVQPAHPEQASQPSEPVPPAAPVAGTLAHASATARRAPAKAKAKARPKRQPTRQADQHTEQAQATLDISTTPWTASQEAWDSSATETASPPLPASDSPGWLPSPKDQHKPPKPKRNAALQHALVSAHAGRLSKPAPQQPKKPPGAGRLPTMDHTPPKAGTAGAGKQKLLSAAVDPVSSKRRRLSGSLSPSGDPAAAPQLATSTAAHQAQATAGAGTRSRGKAQPKVVPGRPVLDQVPSLIPANDALQAHSQPAPTLATSHGGSGANAGGAAAAQRLSDGIVSAPAAKRVTLPGRKAPTSSRLLTKTTGETRRTGKNYSPTEKARLDQLLAEYIPGMTPPSAATQAKTAARTGQRRQQQGPRTSTQLGFDLASQEGAEVQLQGAQQPVLETTNTVAAKLVGLSAPKQQVFSFQPRGARPAQGTSGGMRKAASAATTSDSHAQSAAAGLMLLHDAAAAGLVIAHNSGGRGSGAVHSKQQSAHTTSRPVSTVASALNSARPSTNSHPAQPKGVSARQGSHTSGAVAAAKGLPKPKASGGSIESTVARRALAPLNPNTLQAGAVRGAGQKRQLSEVDVDGVEDDADAENRPIRPRPVLAPLQVPVWRGWDAAAWALPGAAVWPVPMVGVPEPVGDSDVAAGEDPGAPGPPVNPYMDVQRASDLFPAGNRPTRTASGSRLQPQLDGSKQPAAPGAAWAGAGRQRGLTLVPNLPAMPGPWLGAPLIGLGHASAAAGDATEGQGEVTGRDEPRASNNSTAAHQGSIVFRPAGTSVPVTLAPGQQPFWVQTHATTHPRYTVHAAGAQAGPGEPGGNPAAQEGAGEKRDPGGGKEADLQPQPTPASCQPTVPLFSLPSPEGAMFWPWGLTPAPGPATTLRVAPPAYGRGKAGTVGAAPPEGPGQGRSPDTSGWEPDACLVSPQGYVVHLPYPPVFPAAPRGPTAALAAGKPGASSTPAPEMTPALVPDMAVPHGMHMMTYTPITSLQMVQGWRGQGPAAGSHILGGQPWSLGWSQQFDILRGSEGQLGSQAGQLQPAEGAGPQSAEQQAAGGPGEPAMVLAAQQGVPVLAVLPAVMLPAGAAAGQPAAAAGAEPTQAATADSTAVPAGPQQAVAMSGKAAGGKVAEGGEKADMEVGPVVQPQTARSSAPAGSSTACKAPENGAVAVGGDGGGGGQEVQEGGQGDPAAAVTGGGQTQPVDGQPANIRQRLFCSP